MTLPDDLLVAYFSLEFGLDERLPIYAGGLGVLAGDHLKSSSNLGVPLVGVGLFYRHGYFRQEVANGRQREQYALNAPAELGLVRTAATVPVEIGDEAIEAAVWRFDVGDVPLVLLDTDLTENQDWARALTDRLYGGDREARIGQELVLGVGGIRALAALGFEPTVFHLNEGHAAFAALERMRVLVEDDGSSFGDAFEAVRRTTVFTTHTPVPAGNESFDGDLARRRLAPLVERLGVSWETVAALGRSHPDDDGFGLTPLALRTAARRNAVSRLHAEVARRMWAHLWPGTPVDEVPIDHVTNGVHAPTWVSGELSEALLAAGVEVAAREPAWERVQGLDLAELAHVRRHRKDELLRLVADRTGTELDPETLTIGFARRFAAYKRANLLLWRPEELAALLADDERPLQLVFAGKAHPDDAEGKDVLAEIAALTENTEARGRVVFLADYELAVARTLVQGVDVWLNLPRRGEEASGTSGMKAALNGTPNLSVLDGWWAEGYTPESGWAIPGTGAATQADQDAADAVELYRLLREEVLPRFYGEPEPWLATARAAIAAAGSRFTSHRMVAEYAERFYAPAHVDARALRAPSRAPR
ncbi:MAG: alpha-glucan family phosphorylase [Gaiellaceae bacterium]